MKGGVLSEYNYTEKCGKTIESYDKEDGWNLIENCLNIVEGRLDDQFPSEKIHDSAKVNSFLYLLDNIHILFVLHGLFPLIRMLNTRFNCRKMDFSRLTLQHLLLLLSDS